jgi:hypothetical protein
VHYRSAEAVEAEDLVAEEGVTSVSMVFSSSTYSSSSSESLRMMILPSLGGPRTSRLRSPKMNSSSEDEERYTIGSFLEDPPCSNIGEHGRREETSGGDFRIGGDLEGAGGGVLALLGDELPSLEGERARLVPLLSSIDRKPRARKVNRKQARKMEYEILISAR